MASMRSPLRSHAVHGLAGSEPGIWEHLNFEDGGGADLNPNQNDTQSIGESSQKKKI